jgi:multiple sugar transport system substrate-binding protein
MTLSGRARAAALALLAAAACGISGCDGGGDAGELRLRFWAMGREGEVVRDLMPEFERRHPGLRVEVQQIPWSAAHEKLLTAFVGRATPDAAQLGNTWVTEFVALGALEPLDERIAAAPFDSSAFFPGIWETNRSGAHLYGVPWYVDTRLLFYRTDILARAGYDTIPDTWAGWRAAMEAVKREVGPDRYAVFLPVNEWAQPVILGLQAGSPLLAHADTRGAFREPPFRRAFAFYVDLFRDGLAPPLSNNEIANVYQEFGRGTFAMYITGPWNLGEFRRRLPELEGSWATAPLPGPDGPGVSLAGGSSLVVFQGSPEREEASWKLVEYLSRTEVQVEFYRLTGDLPARREAWTDSALAGDPHLRSFGEQLGLVVPTPKLPEWELIATRVQERAELALRGAASPESALALLDRDADRILEKRRWLLERDRLAAGGAEGGP